MLLAYSATPGCAQVAEAEAHWVVALPGARGVKVFVALLLTSAAVTVSWVEHALAGEVRAVICDCAAATAEFMKALASAWQAPLAERTRYSL